MPGGSDPVKAPLNGEYRFDGKCWHWVPDEGVTEMAIQHPSNKGVTATGTTQAAALVLDSDYNEILNGSANAGYILPPISEQEKRIIFVWNGTGNTLKGYPPIGGQINAAGTNANVTHSTGTMMMYVPMGQSGQYYSK
jgi:hypothetical protein